MIVTMHGDGVAQSIKTLKPLDVFRYEGRTLMKVDSFHTGRAKAVDTSNGVLVSLPTNTIVRKIGTLEIK